MKTLLKQDEFNCIVVVRVTLDVRQFWWVRDLAQKHFTHCKY
jgi:hypothetical protein